MANTLENTMSWYVYGIVDPITMNPFYIGKGSKNRYDHHLTETKEQSYNLRKFYKIQSIRSKGFEPKIKIYKYFDDEEEAYGYEEQLIKKYGRKDYEANGILTNFCLGSRPPNRSGIKHQEETLSKMRAKALTRPQFSDEHKSKLKTARMRRNDKPLTQEVKTKISRTNQIAYWETDPMVKRERHNKISKARRGQSITGLMNWDIVAEIRRKYKAGTTKKELHAEYNFISYASINDIIANRTWKE